MDSQTIEHTVPKKPSHSTLIFPVKLQPIQFRTFEGTFQGGNDRFPGIYG